MVKYYVTKGAFFTNIMNRMRNFGDYTNNYEEADIIIFSGGEDINPSIYNSKNIYSYYDDNRDKKEISIYRNVIRMKKILFGICRGHQLLLALNGAKLVQDIYEELGYDHPYEHSIISYSPIIPNYVNSLHHQGVLINNVPPDFEILGVEPVTGIVETTICKDKKIITTQFHPEIMEDNIFSNIINYTIREFTNE